MAFNVTFNQTNPTIAGVTKVEDISGRKVATYSDGTVIDIGPSESTLPDSYGHFRIENGVLELEDSSTIKNFGTLFGQINRQELNVGDVDGDHIVITPTKIKFVSSSGSETIIWSKE